MLLYEAVAELYSKVRLLLLYLILAYIEDEPMYTLGSVGGLHVCCWCNVATGIYSCSCVVENYRALKSYKISYSYDARATDRAGPEFDDY